MSCFLFIITNTLAYLGSSNYLLANREGFVWINTKYYTFPLVLSKQRTLHGEEIPVNPLHGANEKHSAIDGLCRVG